MRTTPPRILRWGSLWRQTPADDAVVISFCAVSAHVPKGSAVASFDPKSFSRNEWGIIGGVFVAFIFLFFKAFGVSVDAGPVHYSAGVSGWHFAGLWVPVLFLAVPAAA